MLFPFGCKTFRLIHVDLLFQIAIEVGVTHIETAKMPVFECSKCEHKPHGFEPYNRREEFVVIDSLNLRVTATNKTCFFTAVCLDVKYPTILEYASAFGAWDEFEYAASA